MLMFNRNSKRRIARVLVMLLFISSVFNINGWMNKVSAEATMTFNQNEDLVMSTLQTSEIAFDIENPGFETGNLSGWTEIGNAFSQRVISESNYGEDKKSYHHKGEYHLSGQADDALGSLQSTTFKLDGTGEVNFLISGNNQPEYQYVALIRASDGEELFKTSGANLQENPKTYKRVIWDAKDYLGQELYLKIVDNGSGYIGVDDFHVNNSIHEIVNPDFETGDLTGWTVVGDDMSSRVKWEVNYWHKDPINKHGHFHFWGDDMLKGSILSSEFVLGGSGEISFMIGGGKQDNQYVSLIDADNQTELMRTRNEWFSESESYTRVTLDASAYLGKRLRVLVADNVAAGGWQHINVDDFQVYQEHLIQLSNPGFETGNLSGWTSEGEAFEDAVTNNAAVNGTSYGHIGTYHLSSSNSDSASGTLTSETFKLGGIGEIELLVGGSNSGKQYVELVRAKDGQTLFKASGEGTEVYKRVVWDTRAYLRENVFIRVLDVGAGHINIDDLQVRKSNSVSYLMENEDFEQGDLNGWTVEGNSFSAIAGINGKVFGYQRDMYAMGTKEGIGQMISSKFRLSGSGMVNFKISGNLEEELYVALIRASDGKELRKEGSTGSSRFQTIEWDVSDYLNETLYFKVVDESNSGNILVDDFNFYVSSHILNADFEAGDMRGWRSVSGNAFNGVVTAEKFHHTTQPFHQQGNYHLWGYLGAGDGGTGILESSHFILEGDKSIPGDGRITYLIGGGKKSMDQMAVELVRDSTGETLFRETGHDDETYRKVDWDATAYIGEELYFRIVDQATDGYGHLNVDHFRTVTPLAEIANPGFETGTLSDWTAQGEAFTQALSVVSGFGHEGTYYLSSKSRTDDTLTGSLRSRSFELDGTGNLSFLISGGNDLNRLYVALVRSKDKEVLFKATGSDSDIFGEVTWDVSSYLGEEVYLEIVDQMAKGSHSYINVDDIQVSTSGTRFADTYRPQYHYTPERNWMNDPNGMVFYEGEYHLFYQHTPFSAQPAFDKMHWGHAVSKDLVHWEELAPAIAPDEDGSIFSGSAVVDTNNTSGFFDKEGSGLVAIYTNNDNRKVPGKPQVQSIAYSKDKGRTWIKYEGNPVLFPEDTVDFRDPKVFWHEETGKWIMSLAVKDRVEFYTSPNLKEWSYASSFGSEFAITHRGIYECPDLFEINVDGDPNHKKWVLIISLGDKNGVNASAPEPPAGGSGMLYFIGEFDGTTFTPDNSIESPEDLNWIDYGADFYAAVSWSGIAAADGRKIWLGWMSNWAYASNTPSIGWRGTMSIPRELKLITEENDTIRLVQSPVDELKNITNSIINETNVTIGSDHNLLDGISADKMEIIAEFELGSAKTFGFKVRKSTNEETVIGYNAESKQLFVDRSKSGETAVHPSFATKHEAPLEPNGNRIKMHIFVDWSSIEVFGGDGKTVISDLIFPDP